ncbi:uncharacterized protein [Typha latifolia]|uniref:uncharacterized protein n=1 Tax=Typha latifolia TaxID=4733 RepID=UPI003C2B0AC2
MLKLNTKSKFAISRSLRFPERKVEVFAMARLSARAQEIDESSEELLGLLHDLPESERELSLANPVVVEVGSVSRSPAKKDMARLVRERKMSSSSRRSFGSSGDGVLLNFYVPTSLTRSLTAPRGTRRIVDNNTTDCNKRDREHATFGCWSVLWQGRRGRSRRQVLE